MVATRRVIWAQREVEIEQRWGAHVAPTTSRLDQEIALQKASLESAANRFEHLLATSRMVIGHGLEQQRHASNLAHRVAAERNHLDGPPHGNRDTPSRPAKAATRRPRAGTSAAATRITLARYRDVSGSMPATFLSRPHVASQTPQR
jgi:hypothetical protein